MNLWYFHRALLAELTLIDHSFRATGFPRSVHCNPGPVSKSVVPEQQRCYTEINFCGWQHRLIICNKRTSFVNVYAIVAKWYLWCLCKINKDVGIRVCRCTCMYTIDYIPFIISRNWIQHNIQKWTLRWSQSTSLHSDLLTHPIYCSNYNRSVDGCCTVLLRSLPIRNAELRTWMRLHGWSLCKWIRDYIFWHVYTVNTVCIMCYNCVYIHTPPYWIWVPSWSKLVSKW